jgi:hypothetical protein
MKEEKPRDEEANKPNHDRVRFFVKDFNKYKPVK